MPLREHGAQPGREAASPVVVAEERGMLPSALVYTEQVGVQAVGQISCVAVRVDGIRGAVERRPQFENEVLPGGIVSVSARARQREVRDMQGLKV
jgi:hypothetical protein